MLPREKVKIKWSFDFAYAIGLIATDGYLSSSGRHISFTSKDKEQIKNYMKALYIFCHVGKKSSGTVKWKKYYVVQFSDVSFYNFLLSIGITRAKKKNICYQLKYAKREATKLFSLMNQGKKPIHLSRKYLKIKAILDIVGGQS